MIIDVFSIYLYSIRLTSKASPSLFQCWSRTRWKSLCSLPLSRPRISRLKELPTMKLSRLMHKLFKVERTIRRTQSPWSMFSWRIASSKSKVTMYLLPSQEDQPGIGAWLATRLSSKRTLLSLSGAATLPISNRIMSILQSHRSRKTLISGDNFGVSSRNPIFWFRS